MMQFVVWIILDHFEPYNPEAPGITGPPPGAPPFWHGPPPIGGPPGMPPFIASQPPPHIRQRDHLITIKQEEGMTIYSPS